MSASIRIEIMGGTHIEEAYFDCDNISRRLGGVPVVTCFNGVEMFYHHQSLEEWQEEYQIKMTRRWR